MPKVTTKHSPNWGDVATGTFNGKCIANDSISIGKQVNNLLSDKEEKWEH